MKFRQAYKIMKRPYISRMIVYCPIADVVILIPTGLKLSNKAVRCFMRHAKRSKKKNCFTIGIDQFKTEIINVEPILQSRI